MGRQTLSKQAIGFLCLISIGVTAQLHSKGRSNFEVAEEFQHSRARAYSSVRPQSVFSLRESIAKETPSLLTALWLRIRGIFSAYQQVPTDQTRPHRQRYRSRQRLRRKFSNSPSLTALKPYQYVLEKWKAARGFVVQFSSGVSHDSMEKRFGMILRSDIVKHCSRAFGGLIEVYGARDKHRVQKCVQRPSLTMKKVHSLTRASSDATNFSLPYPLCNNGGKIVPCAYDAGICCRRPQVEFIGRHYDTAVAAMALGATREEAFSPLVHARVLAYALISCDPETSYLEDASSNRLSYFVRRGRRRIRKEWQGGGTSLVAFPKAYEVLYEVYNTMLIERIRSRKATRLPRHAQMKALRDAVYYKKLLARVTFIDLDLDPAVVFPDWDDIRKAGLSMQPDFAGQKGNGVANSSGAEAEPTVDSEELHPALRLSSLSISLFEVKTRSWVRIDAKECNEKLPASEYFPFKYQTRVWSRLQGCCARECNFLNLYGNAFSGKGSNCCSNCNRYSCKANSLSAAGEFARVSAIEASSKTNSGPEEVAMFI